MRRVIARAVCAAVPASASAGKYPKPVNCGTGEPAYTGWNYTELMAYGLSCRKAHSTAEEYVYDLSTEGVIEPPAHRDRCKDKQVGDGVWKDRCVRVKGDKPQKLTFLFGGSDLDWF